MKKHISFFSGMRGFDFAAEMAGWENVASVEIDESLNRRFKNKYPNAHQHTDIRDTDFTPYRGTIDVVSAGWPCQPNSNAGKRLGREDVRFLWPESIRGIREIQPKWVVGENVRGIVSIEGGLVFEQVFADLEAAGYEVQSFILPAAGINATHERHRTWFVAHSIHPGTRRECGQTCNEKRRTSEDWGASIRQGNGAAGTGRNNPANSNASNAHGTGLAELRRITGNYGAKQPSAFRVHDVWENWTSEPPVCDVDDGIPVGVDVARLRADIARLYPTATEKNIERAIQRTITAYRNEMIKAAGNAVVWQIPYRIFQCINQFDKAK